MKRIIFMFLLIILVSAMSGCVSKEEAKEEKKAYQEELDKILPLNEEIEATRTEIYGNNRVIRGRIDNVGTGNRLGWWVT